MAESTLELAYQEALRAITQQQAVLVELRSRANILLGAAAIAGSFLGAASLKPTNAAGNAAPLGVSGWIAVGSFIAVSVAVLAILLPIPGWRFRTGGKALIRGFIEVNGRPPADLPTMYRELAIRMDNNYERNQRRIDALFWVYRLAVVLLTTEVVAFIFRLKE